MKSRNSPPRLHAHAAAAPSEPDPEKLARLIRAYAPHDGSLELHVTGLHASRSSRINRECARAFRLPYLCIVAQGHKTVIVGQQVCQCEASGMVYRRPDRATVRCHNSHR